MAENKHWGRRTGLMLLGILLIGLCVAFYRLAAFGVDAFTGMNLGISLFLGWSFGNWQLVANILILIVVFFTVRRYIGFGTLVNMVCVGYIADFVCWLVQDKAQWEYGMPMRIVFLVIAQFFASLGVALYMKADMGLSPYDSVAPIIEKISKGKIPFQYARIGSDITAIIIGIVFCLLSGNKIWMVVGIGTVTNAFLNGPLIKWFGKYLDKWIPEGDAHADS